MVMVWFLWYNAMLFLKEIKRRVLNFFCVMKGPVNLWISYNYDAPLGYYHVNTYEDALEILQSCLVVNWALCGYLGLKVAFGIQQGAWPVRKPMIYGYYEEIRPVLQDRSPYKEYRPKLYLVKK